MCKGADAKDVDLASCSVKVAGTITRDGQIPQVSLDCSPTSNGYSTYAQVELKETTWGYSSTIANTCAKGATQGFDWARTIFPGTYQVTVYGTTNYEDFPVGGSEVVVEAIRFGP